MRRRALLAVIVVLLLIGAYGAYVVSYPKYPEVKGCVNPFKAVKPLNRVQENWSKAHVFFKLATSRDFWKLAKPWDVDYSHVKVVKHTLEYNGENITMLAIGIPLKDKKHIIVFYEFSEPVQRVRTVARLMELENSTLKTTAISTNGNVKPLSECNYECSSGSDCGVFGQCKSYCCGCSSRPLCLSMCCALCSLACRSPDIVSCVSCVLLWCPTCCYVVCCDQSGTYCDYLSPGP